MRNFFFLGLVLVGVLSACSSFEKDAGAQADRTQQEYLRRIEASVEDRQCDQALHEIAAFRRSFPETPYFQTSRLLEGRCLYELARYKEAIELYEKVQTATLDNNTKLWAEARYQSSFAYEALGDTENALSILFGLEKSKAALPDDIAMAELPARVASLYFEQGRDKESSEYLDKAERGLRILMREKGIEDNRRRFAETLYHMGKVISPHMTTENFPRILQAHRRAQTYLIRAMELNAPGWSQRAADDLVKSYRNYWNFIQAQWGLPEETPERIEALKTVHTMLSESMYRQPSEPEMWNDSLKAYFSFAVQLEKEVSAGLFTARETTLMTEKPIIKPPSKPRQQMKPQEDVVSPDPNM